ncbi:MAG: SCO family protein [Epsilonproteobacteria bacterium]|nr:SCO family protein [Campylobacterota bacterium]
MSLTKKLFGSFLILFSLLVIVMIGLPQIYANNAAGRIDKEITVDLKFLNGETSPVVLLYFGYVGCETICTPAMSEISQIYRALDPDKTEVYFVNLLEHYDKELPTLFAKHFHKDFHGVYLTKEEILKVVNQLRINYTTSLRDISQLNHSGYLYLLEKSSDNLSYQQKYMYTTRPFHQEAIISDVRYITQQGITHDKTLSASR